MKSGVRGGKIHDIIMYYYIVLDCCFTRYLKSQYGHLTHTQIRASIGRADSVLGEDKRLGKLGGSAATAMERVRNALEQTGPGVVSDGRNQTGLLLPSSLILVDYESAHESGMIG